MVIGAIGHWPGVIYKAVGRPDILNKLGFLKLAMLVPALWWAAVNFGILGVAWAQLVVRIVGIIIDMYVVSRFVRISVTSNLRIIWPPFGASLVMAACVRAILLADTTGKSIPALIAAITVGALVYVGAVWLLDRQAVTALLALARGMARRERASVVEVPGEG
jgi:PST family polysaccharide transporter